MESLVSRCTLKFDNIGFRVGDIDGRALALSTVACGDRADLDALCLQMAANVRFVEWLHPDAEVIHVAPFPSWRRASGFAEFAVHWNEINERPTGTQLYKADFVLPPLYGASENVAVKVKHAVEVDNAQYKMVDFANSDHCA
jgi:hypothetical protein